MSCLVNKEQKVMFLVVSRSDINFGFEHPFFRDLSDAQVKLRARKGERLERNVSTPDRIIFQKKRSIMKIKLYSDKTDGIRLRFAVRTSSYYSHLNAFHNQQDMRT